LCQGESVVLTAVTDAPEWGWNTGATSLSVIASSSGYYVFTGTTPCGQCKDSIEVLVVSPSAQFSVNPLSGPAPLTVDVTNASQGVLDYQWLLDGQQLSNAFVPNVLLEQAGQYDLTLIVTDLQGCSNVMTVTILVYDEVQIEIPNVFTPNNDGSNDFFGISTSMALPLNYSILNRWGNVVKTETLLTNDTQFTPLWNGNVDSAQATEGVYFYQFEFTLPSGEISNYSGFFNLVK
jgi:gliding motility-associated-like protein